MTDSDIAIVFWFIFIIGAAFLLSLAFGWHIGVGVTLLALAIKS